MSNIASMGSKFQRTFHATRQQKVNAGVIIAWGILLAPLAITAGALVAFAGLLMLSGLAALRNVTRFVPTAGRRIRMLAGALAANTVASVTTIAVIVPTIFTRAERNARPHGRLARLPSVSLAPRLAARPRSVLSA